MSVDQSDLPQAWRPVAGDDAARLEAVLRREMRPGHLLYDRPSRAVARCLARDDVLLHLDDLGLYAVVHLTYSDHPGAYVEAILKVSDLRWFLLMHDPDD